MNLKKFIAELKRRNVFKVATAYAIVGWLIIQIVTAIDEPLSLPDWFDTTIIILVFIGFPIALVIAWAFELTPDGVKKSTEVDNIQSVTASTGKKLNRLIIGVLALAVVFLLINRVFYAESTSNEDEISEMASIAVLPFADMSPKSDQEYFSDGLSEELLNVLAKENNMKVAGRTSSFRYKGKNDDLKKIGAELGVAHILEGSVRKSGNQIRITAQLIKVADGFHEWSETYNREYSAENLFQIQDEISQSVLKELKIKLLGSTNQIKALPTKNTKAYEAYLKANQLVVNRNAKQIEEAITYYEEAIALDPDFAQAYARLGIAYGLLVDYGNIDPKLAVNLIRENADKALLLDNTLGISYSALSSYYRVMQRYNFNSENSRKYAERYEEACKKAYELNPNNSEIVILYANSIPDYGNKKLKLELLLKCYELDPLAPNAIQALARSYYLKKDFERAVVLLKKNIKVNPDYTDSKYAIIRTLKGESQGKLDEAFIEAYKMHPKELPLLYTLVETALDLKLFLISDDVNKKMQTLYPGHIATLQSQGMSYRYKNQLEEYNMVLFASLNKGGSKAGDMWRLDYEITRFNANKDYKGAMVYVKKYHPEFLSDTLNVTQIENIFNPPLIRNIIFIANISEIYKKGGNATVSNKLRTVYCNTVSFNYKFEGDITKESSEQLEAMMNCALLNNDAKLAIKLHEEYFFNRKNKVGVFTSLDTGMLWQLIHGTPEFKKYRARVETDLQAMRNNAITFLKAEKAWPEGMKE